MDPHFHEYLAAIAGMCEIYGEPLENHPTEFHEDHTTSPVSVGGEALAEAGAWHGATRPPAGRTIALPATHSPTRSRRHDH